MMNFEKVLVFFAAAAAAHDVMVANGFFKPFNCYGQVREGRSQIKRSSQVPKQLKSIVNIILCAGWTKSCKTLYMVTNKA